MDQPQNSERRSSPRHGADFRVLFGMNGDLVPGFLADISPMGISILSGKHYPVGAEIEVHFALEEDHPDGKLQMRAVVRHCAGGKVGAQFLGLRPSDREFLWKIMRGVV